MSESAVPLFRKWFIIKSTSQINTTAGSVFTERLNAGPIHNTIHQVRADQGGSALEKWIKRSFLIGPFAAITDPSFRRSWRQ